MLDLECCCGHITSVCGETMLGGYRDPLKVCDFRRISKISALIGHRVIRSSCKCSKTVRIHLVAHSFTFSQFLHTFLLNVLSGSQSWLKSLEWHSYFQLMKMKSAQLSLTALSRVFFDSEHVLLNCACRTCSLSAEVIDLIMISAPVTGITTVIQRIQL